MAEITLLNDHPEFAPILGHWSYMLWYRHRDINFPTVMKSYLQRAKNDIPPLCYVAVEDTAPVGMATLKNDDLWSRKDLNPWLASLYVLADCRKKGIAGELINAVLTKARELGFGRVFLFLGQEEQDRLVDFYESRGWEFYEDALDNDGLPTRIYYRDL